jgi:hypothetical protein
MTSDAVSPRKSEKKQGEQELSPEQATAAPSWLILVFKFSADFGDRVAEVVG